MKKLSLLLLTLVLVAGCATTMNTREVMQDSYLQGVQAYEDYDYDKAFSLLKSAATAGNPNAQYLLAILYDFGRGTSTNHEEANVWYLKAAEQGQDDAQFNLAISYRRGEGIEQNHDMAVYWLGKAAANGDRDAMRVLVNEYSDTYPEAQYALAHIYRDGITLHNNLDMYPNEEDNQEIAPDAEEYRYWLKMAAENGHPEAMKELENLKP